MNEQDCVHDGHGIHHTLDGYKVDIKCSGFLLSDIILSRQSSRVTTECMDCYSLDFETKELSTTSLAADLTSAAKPKVPSQL